MNDREAAAIIKKLIPSIQSDGPGALVKYANEHDLAPALLEKLAQVANRLITLHHIDTSEDRGSSVPLLDVPEMVREYSMGSDTSEKQASVALIASHDPGSIDLMRMLVSEAGVGDIEKIASAPDPLSCVLEFSGLLSKLQAAHWEADTETEEHEALGDLYEALQPCLDRYVEASMGDSGVRHMSPAEVNLSPGADRRALVGDIKRAVKKLQTAAKKVGSEALLNVAAEMEEHVLKAIYKLDNKAEKVAAVTDVEIEEAANAVYGMAVNDREKVANELLALLQSDSGFVTSVAYAEREALAEGYDAECVKNAFDWLCTMRKSASADRFEGQVRVRSMSADTRLSRAASEFVVAHTTVGLSRDISKELGKSAAAAAPPVEDDLDNEPTKPLTGGEYTADADTAERADSGGGGGQGGGDGGGGQGGERERSREGQDERESRQPKSKPTPSGKPDSKSDGSSHDWAGLIAAPIGRVADSVSTAADMANNAMSAVTGKERQNTAQRRLDVSAEDIVRTIMVRRMVATDPILREADPRKVLDVYNAVARLNPSVAANPEQLRLALREAVSYDGLTLDSQKLLTDTRKSEEDATAKARDNQRARYSVGGSELPSLLKGPVTK